MTTEISAAFIARLSVAQREELIKHVPAPQPIVRWRDDNRLKTILRLMELDLLRGDQPITPRFTHLTMLGREAVAHVLGQYADALVAAGVLERQRRPLDLAAKIRLAADQTRLIPARLGKPYQDPVSGL
jgi:hypothetical protein